MIPLFWREVNDRELNDCHKARMNQAHGVTTVGQHPCQMMRAPAALYPDQARRLLDLKHQARALTVFDGYLTKLYIQKKWADGVAELARQQPELGLEIPDFPTKTWETLHQASKLPLSRSSIPYSPRRDGIGRPVPNVVFKVPTGGGGKTYLAVSALSCLFGRYGRYLGKNTGFVLWIVPNEVIYSQARRQLSDRQHPYRQMLDRAAAGRVRLLEKNERLDAHDVEAHLRVMLLMLPSANRQTRESPRLFRDRGDVHGFFHPKANWKRTGGRWNKRPISTPTARRAKGARSGRWSRIRWATRRA